MEKLPTARSEAHEMKVSSVLPQALMLAIALLGVCCYGQTQAPATLKPTNAPRLKLIDGQPSRPDHPTRPTPFAVKTIAPTSIAPFSPTPAPVKPHNAPREIPHHTGRVRGNTARPILSPTFAPTTCFETIKCAHVTSFSCDNTAVCNCNVKYASGVRVVLSNPNCYAATVTVVSNSLVVPAGTIATFSIAPYTLSCGPLLITTMSATQTCTTTVAILTPS